MTGLKIDINNNVIEQFFVNRYINIIKGKNQIYILIIILALISCVHSGNSTLNHDDNNGKNDVEDAYLVDQISDQDSLLKVAQTDKSSSVRMDAVERLTDQDVLIDIAQTDKSRKVRKAAVERITDQDFLIRAAHTDKSVKVRKAAVERITDKDVLIEVAQMDKSYQIQLAAARTVQYVLDKKQFPDYLNIKEDVANLMLFLLDPVIIGRHGLLKMEIETDRNYIVKIKTLSGDTILKRTFVTTTDNAETFAGTTKYKDAKIDYEGIKTLLWFLSSTK